MLLPLGEHLLLRLDFPLKVGAHLVLTVENRGQVFDSCVPRLLLRLLLVAMIFQLGEEAHFFVLEHLQLSGLSIDFLPKRHLDALGFTPLFSVGLDELLQLRAVLLPQGVQRGGLLAQVLTVSGCMDIHRGGGWVKVIMIVPL